jgi:hypothetical protein
LGRLRLSVLVCGEKLPDKCWNSDGLSRSGQDDLKIVFPRSSVLAAVSHAAALARTHHDERTRAQGVYHLFRLPAEMEAGIHRALIEMEQDSEFGDDPAAGIWDELGDLDRNTEAASEGPVDLGTLDLYQRPVDWLNIGANELDLRECHETTIGYRRSPKT